MSNGRLDFFDYEDLPDHVKYSLRLYVEDGVVPGHFLTAVLSNDLFGAYDRADSESLAALPRLVRFIYNRVPSNAWGSKAAMRAYIASKIG